VKSIIRRALVKIILALSIVLVAQAQDDLAPNQSRFIAEEIAAEINSPFCPGRLLRDCPSSAAQSLKTDIQNWIASGKSKEEVKSNLLAKFGEEINPLPSFIGFNALAWIAPFLFVLFAIIGGIVWLIKHKPFLKS